ncbi:hypothetical protein COBT_001043 [Conglomerata obtusa]
MQSIRDLIIASKANPQYLKPLETAIQTVSLDTSDYHTITTLFQDPLFDCKFYGTVILQKRLKVIVKETNSQKIELYITFINYAIEISSSNQILSNKLSDLYALVTIYYYPVHNVNVFNVINGAIINNVVIGYLILKKYLFMLNTSSEISNDRKIELRKLSKEPVKNLLMTLLNKHEEVKLNIEIFTYALVGFKELSDAFLEYVIKYGHDFNMESLDFFTEFISYRSENTTIIQIVNFAKLVNDNNFKNKIIEIFLIANKESYLNEQLINFVLQCIEFECCFENGLEFFNKFYKNLNFNKANKEIENKYENLSFNVLKILIFKINKINEQLEQLKRNNADMEEYTNEKIRIEELIKLISCKFTQVTLHLLSNFSNEIPLNILVILIERCSLKKDFVFNNDFLNCFSEFKRNDSVCVRYLDQINFNSSDSVKLASRIIKKFKIDDIKILKLLNDAQNYQSEFLDDFIVCCIASVLKQNDKSSLSVKTYLGLPESINWDLGRRKKFYCFLKKDISVLKEYFNSFYNYMLKTNETEINFSILGVIQKEYEPVPQEILVKLYNNIQTYNLKEIMMLTNDLVNYLNNEFIKTFIQRIFDKIILEFDDADQQEAISCVKAFLNFIERKITLEINTIHIQDMANHSQMPIHDKNIQTPYLQFYAVTLTELLVLKEVFVVRKINDIFAKSEIKFDTNNVIYKLLMSYNANEMVDGQSDILGFILFCLSKTDDLNVLSLVPNSTPEKIESLRSGINHGSLKNKKDVLKEFLKDVKGKSVHEMFSENVVIEKLGFLPKKSTNLSSIDVSEFFK